MTHWTQTLLALLAEAAVTRHSWHSTVGTVGTAQLPHHSWHSTVGTAQLAQHSWHSTVAPVSTVDTAQLDTKNGGSISWGSSDTTQWTQTLLALSAGAAATRHIGHKNCWLY